MPAETDDDATDSVSINLLILCLYVHERQEGSLGMALQVLVLSGQGFSRV